jgi:hypothetical protein
MGVLEDVRNWLKEIPLWQELEKIPRRMDDLEARVSALEKALERVPGDACPKCEMRAMRLKQAGSPRGGKGNWARLDTWSCTADGCDHVEMRQVRL